MKEMIIDMESQLLNYDHMDMANESPICRDNENSQVDPKEKFGEEFEGGNHGDINELLAPMTSTATNSNIFMHADNYETTTTNGHYQAQSAPIQPEEPADVSDNKESIGRWTKDEHAMFLKGMNAYGRNWKMIALTIPTRTVVQIRTHAQKHFQKLEKSGNGSGTSTSASKSAASNASASNDGIAMAKSSQRQEHSENRTKKRALTCTNLDSMHASDFQPSFKIKNPSIMYHSMVESNYMIPSQLHTNYTMDFGVSLPSAVAKRGIDEVTPSVHSVNYTDSLATDSYLSQFSNGIAIPSSPKANHRGYNSNSPRPRGHSTSHSPSFSPSLTAAFTNPIGVSAMEDSLLNSDRDRVYTKLQRSKSFSGGGVGTASDIEDKKHVDETKKKNARKKSTITNSNQNQSAHSPISITSTTTGPYNTLQFPHLDDVMKAYENEDDSFAIAQGIQDLINSTSNPFQYSASSMKHVEYSDPLTNDHEMNLVQLELEDNYKQNQLYHVMSQEDDEYESGGVVTSSLDELTLSCNALWDSEKKNSSLTNTNENVSINIPNPNTTTITSTVLPILKTLDSVDITLDMDNGLKSNTNADCDAAETNTTSADAATAFNESCLSDGLLELFY